MCSIQNNDSWREFFECLKDLPALWKVKDDIFKNREEKRKAWDKLLEKYRKIEKDASLEEVKRKLLNIKACYRRELKKVESSGKSGCSSDEIHVPNLWYFDLLEFLRDQERHTSGLSSMDLSDEVEAGIEVDELAGTTMRRKKRSVAHHMAERNALLRLAINNLGPPNEKPNEADIYAKSLATSIEKLNYTQQIFAKKAIEEILALGQLEQLTLNTVATSLAPQYRFVEAGTKEPVTIVTVNAFQNLQ